VVFSLGTTAVAELKPDTLKAWNHYLQEVDARAKARLDSRHSFLWIDEDSERLRQIRAGNIEVAPVADQGLHPVYHGLIHDWIGGAFIAGVSIEDVLAVVRNYNRYPEVFKPTVVTAKVLGSAEDQDVFSMRWMQKVLFLSAGLEGVYETHYHRHDSTHLYTVTRSTRLQEIADYGAANERLFAPDQGPGFVWRVYSVTRYQQRDGGVYLEVEGLVLSRDIPLGMRWFLKPVIEGLSRRSVATVLDQTRHGVHPRVP
jgi:hypothetical protein